MNTFRLNISCLFLFREYIYLVFSSVVVKVVHISPTTRTVASMAIPTMMTSTMMSLVVSCVPKQQRVHKYIKNLSLSLTH